MEPLCVDEVDVLIDCYCVMYGAVYVMTNQCYVLYDVRCYITTDKCYVMYGAGYIVFDVTYVCMSFNY